MPHAVEVSEGWPHDIALCMCRPFNDATIFNTQIRNLVQTVKYRGGRRSIPIAEKRAAGFRQLRIAMKVSSVRIWQRMLASQAGPAWQSGTVLMN